MTGLRDEQPLFHQPWWLDAVSPGTWGEAVVEGEAHLAWQRTEGRRGTLLTTPPLTRMGPWVRDTGGSYATAVSREKRLVAELLEQLPAADLVQLALPPDGTSWLPFHWAGFSTTARMTYVLDDVVSEDDAWSRCTDKTRNAVRKAQQGVVVESSSSAEPLVELVTTSLDRQGASRLEPALVRRVHAAVASHDAGRTLVARDRAGHVVAAALVAWDRATANYLLAGASDEGRALGAQSALLWEAIRCSLARTGRFDFEGSMLPQVEPVFRGFGGRQATFVVVERTSRRYRALRAARDLGRAARS